MQLCADKEFAARHHVRQHAVLAPAVRDLGAKLDAICGKIKNEDDRREAMCLARIFLSARENAQRCAVPALVTTSSCAADTGLTQRRSLSHTFT